MLNADVEFHVLEQVIPEGSVRHVAGTCKGHGPTIHRCGTQEALAEQLVDVENKATLYQTARVGSARAARSVPPHRPFPARDFAEIFGQTEGCQTKGQERRGDSLFPAGDFSEIFAQRDRGQTEGAASRANRTAFAAVWSSTLRRRASDLRGRPKSLRCRAFPDQD